MPTHLSEMIKPWVVCLSSALFFFFVFLQVNMFNAISPALIQNFQMNSTTLGHLSAFYFYGTVLFLFPAGMILDRYSTRSIILIAMFISVICTFLFSVAEHIWQAELSRFVIGICGAFCLLSSVKLASRWFPPKRMALIVGLIVTLAMLGGMCAQTPLTLLTDNIGWRKALVYDSIMGIFLLAIVAYFVKDYPKGKEHFHKIDKNELNNIGFWPALFQTVSNKQNILAGLYASLIDLPVFLLGATWGSLYLVQIRELNRAQASLVVSMIFIGMIIGCPVLGWLSDWLERRKLPMVMGAIASLIIILIIIYAPNLTFLSLSILFFILGFVVSSQVIAYPLVAESNPKILTGTSEGLASVLIMAGGFVIPLFPLLLNLHWNNMTINQIPIYSLTDYRLALMIMPIAFLIALGASFFVKETYCQSYVKKAITPKDEAEVIELLSETEGAL